MVFNRPVDDATEGYRFGLWAGLCDIADGVHGTKESLGDIGMCSREGYFDALDDSDDMPGPFDQQETIVP